MPKDPTIAIRDCLAEIAILHEIEGRMTLQAFGSDPIGPPCSGVRAMAQVRLVMDLTRHQDVRCDGARLNLNERELTGRCPPTVWKIKIGAPRIVAIYRNSKC
jgi:hypothetical protein